MTAPQTAPLLHPAPSQATWQPEHLIHVAPTAGDPDPSAPQPPATTCTGPASHHPAGHRDSPALRSWPLLILALPAAVAVWSGWVGIGQMTGFGQVHPLPGIWHAFHLDTAVTLPVGVEAYAAYALRAWLSASTMVSARTRRFARRSAIGSLLLGMAGQITYHLLAQAHAARAPWDITTAVSCLPVLVLGMGAALAHLLRADSCHRRTTPPRATPPTTTPAHTPPPSGPPGGPRQPPPPRRRRRVSRRTLRTAGLHGSNTDLGALAITLKAHPSSSPHQDLTASPPSPTPA